MYIPMFVTMLFMKVNSLIQSGGNHKQDEKEYIMRNKSEMIILLKIKYV